MHFSTQLPVSDMPRLLKEGAMVSQTPQQCDMLMLSIMTVSGYAMPHYYMRSGKPARKYEPALMTLIVAPPASGKGIMNLGRRLLQPIHERMRQETDEMMLMAETKEEQAAVPQLMGLVPGNSSSNALLQILNDNEGRGCIIETEMDVISQIWHHDYGNYSTLLRQAFEHETVCKARKTKADAYLEVKHPALSVLLSGTFGQLQPLLQSRENGLASRFICYLANDIIPFDQETILKHDEEQDDRTDEIYQALAEQTTQMYDWLNGQKSDCEWRLTPEQATELRDHWGGNYETTLGYMQMPTSFDPVVKRLAVTSQRIGMILSMIRYFDEVAKPLLDEGKAAPLPEVIECDERDFRTMLVFADVLTEHAIGVHQMLPGEGAELVAVQTEALPEAAADLLQKLPEKFTKKEAEEAGKAQGISERTVRNYLVRYIDEHLAIKTGYGKYQKIEK